MIRPPKFEWNIKPNQVQALTRRYKDNALDAVQDAMSDAADFAADWIKLNKIYQGSRTGTLWHDLTNEERGNQEGARKETGEMYNSVGSTGARYLADGEYSAEFGLRLPSAGGRKYFLEQDQGFPLELASGEVRQVPGMHTFEAVLTPMTRYFRKEMLRRGFLRGGRDTKGERILRNAEFESFDAAWSGQNLKNENQRQAMRQNQINRFEAQARQDAIRGAQIESYRASQEALYGSIPNWMKAFKK